MKMSCGGFIILFKFVFFFFFSLFFFHFPSSLRYSYFDIISVPLFIFLLFSGGIVLVVPTRKSLLRTTLYNIRSSVYL